MYSLAKYSDLLEVQKLLDYAVLMQGQGLINCAKKVSKTILKNTRKQNAEYRVLEF